MLPGLVLVSALALAGPEPVAARHLVTEYASLANITYAVAGGTELKLDVYRPRTVGPPRPTLVFVHGGGWVSGAKEDAVLWLIPWLGAGWTAVNVEYRISRAAHAPAAVEDVRCALGKHGGFTGAEMDTAYAAIRAFLEAEVGVPAP